MTTAEPGTDLREVPTKELVAELTRRNRTPRGQRNVANLLAGLTEDEILDFVDWGAVTADEARAYMKSR